MVQWLRLHTPNAGGVGSISGQGTRAHMPQLRPGTAKIKKIITIIILEKRTFENCCSEPFFSRRSGLWSLQPGIRPLIENLGAFWEFLGGPVVRTLCSHCRGCRFSPWLGN